MDNRTVFLESIAACLAVTAAAWVLSPLDGGLRRPGPYLTWMAVLLLAARYGGQGLCLSLPVAAGLATVMAYLLDQVPLLERRLDGSADLLALVAAVVVAWVASTQESRRADLAAQLETMQIRCADERKAAGEMRETLIALRSRADRMNLSLTFLRHVAQRLEGRDPQEAVMAALALAMTCLEARGGVVKLGVAGSANESAARPTLLSWAGAWNSDGSAPTLDGDRVVAAAITSSRAMNAADVAGAGPGDADMATPLLDRGGLPFGVLAVRGLPYRTAGAMALRDLAVVGEWLGQMLDESARPALAAVPSAERDRSRLAHIEVTCSSDLTDQPLSAEVQG